MLVHLASPGPGQALQAALRAEVQAAGPRLWADAAAAPEVLFEKLPLARAALNESMRYKPVGPVVIRRSMDGPVDLNVIGRSTGQPASVLHLEAGTTVVLNLQRMARSEALFACPRSFAPEANFPDAGAAPPGFTPFGAGRKGCVGEPLAWKEMLVLLGSILTTFELPSSTAPSSTAPSAQESTAADGGSRCPAKVGLDAVTSHWHIANQPVETILVPFRARPLAKEAVRPVHIFLVGAHGAGKTTLLNALRADATLLGTLGPVAPIVEVARGIMAAESFTRADLADAARYAQLQRWIVAAQADRERHLAAAHFVSDRSAIDTLAYQEFTGGPGAADELAHAPNVIAMMAEYRSPRSFVFLVPPFISGGKFNRFI